MNEFALPAFIISIIAAAIALTALGWNIVSWMLNGARVTIECFAMRGPGNQYVQVVVRNRGRAAVTVNAVTLYSSDSKRRKHLPALILGSEEGGLFEDEKPHRLEPNADIKFDENFDSTRSLFGDRYFRAMAELATGRVAKTKWVLNEKEDDVL